MGAKLDLLKGGAKRHGEEGLRAIQAVFARGGSAREARRFADKPGQVRQVTQGGSVFVAAGTNLLNVADRYLGSGRFVRDLLLENPDLQKRTSDGGESFITTDNRFIRLPRHVVLGERIRGRSGGETSEAAEALTEQQEELRQQTTTTTPTATGPSAAEVGVVGGRRLDPAPIEPAVTPQQASTLRLGGMATAFQEQRRREAATARLQGLADFEADRGPLSPLDVIRQMATGFERTFTPVAESIIEASPGVFNERALSRLESLGVGLPEGVGELPSGIPALPRDMFGSPAVQEALTATTDTATVGDDLLRDAATVQRQRLADAARLTTQALIGTRAFDENGFPGYLDFQQAYNNGEITVEQLREVREKMMPIVMSDEMVFVLADHMRTDTDSLVRNLGYIPAGEGMWYRQDPVASTADLGSLYMGGLGTSFRRGGGSGRGFGFGGGGGGRQFVGFPGMAQWNWNITVAG